MSELPHGAVTFLLTDIEGSTRLVKQLRDRYGDVLATHQRLLRDAFARHGGHEIDTQGDAFFVADVQTFTARTPVTRSLRQLPWPYTPCKVEADATLTGRGRLTIEVLGR